jgi:hypothetical protein
MSYTALTSRVERFVQPESNPVTGIRLHSTVMYRGDVYRVVSTQVLNSGNGMALEHEEGKHIIKVFGNELSSIRLSY